VNRERVIFMEDNYSFTKYYRGISFIDIVLTETLLFWIVNSILMLCDLKAGEDFHKTIPLLFQSVKPFINQIEKDILELL